MEKLRNIKKATNDITNILCQDEKIKKLLVNDSKTALEDGEIQKTYNDLISEGYISYYAPSDTGIEDAQRNTFISMYVQSIIPRDDNSYRTEIVLYVTTDKEHLALKNNKNRLLELCDCILGDLQQQKITSSGEISIGSISHVMFSDFRLGYRIMLTLLDQETGKVEI